MVSNFFNKVVFMSNTIKSKHISHLRSLLCVFLLSVSGSFVLVGCSPINAHSAISQAKIALETAKGIRAHDYAIYEYRRAQLYYDKAKEEEGYSSFQKAIDYAMISRDFSDKARALTAERSQEQRKQVIKTTQPTLPKPY